MTKTKVRKHTRRIKGKKVRVRKHQRKVKIDKRKRMAFTALAQQPFELGGQLDFEGEDLENAKVHFGKDSELEFLWDPDFEVSFHTHPPFEGASIMPSFEDFLSMKLTNEKEQIILHRNVAISIAEKKKFENVSVNKIREVSNKMQGDLSELNDKELFNKYKPILKNELGLSMKWHSPDKDIQLESRSV